MADPYWRYTASADRVYSSYLSSDASALSSQPWRSSLNDLGTSSAVQKDILGPPPGVGIGARPESSSNGYPSSWEDRYLVGKRDAISVPEIPSILNDRPDSLRKADSIPVGGRESNVLFVDGLPSDCSRREVSHLFRPFNGFKEIRLVHKEPRDNADKAMVLCFVEFGDSNQALTALEALQGYKFDNKKPESTALRIHFAHFPFQLPSDDAQPHISSKFPPDNVHIPSQPPPESARFSSQLLADSTVYSSKLPLDSALFPSPQPHDRPQFSSQLPLDSAHFSSQLPLSSAHFPSQLPLNGAHSPFHLQHREEQERERELAVQDDEPVVKNKKFKGGSSKKKQKVEDSKNEVKKWCIKCKQNHYGECYNFKNCYICGKPGHIGKECTNKPRLCYGCGEAGHIHSLCPNGPRSVKKVDRRMKLMKSMKNMVQSKNKNGYEVFESDANIVRRIWLLHLPSNFSIMRVFSFSYSSFPAHVVCYAKLFVIYFKPIHLF
ncbi:hypothetical protein QVD17_29880 [Tagetes erecta]|uniref:Uncharacterized protein n=1 Tax=Tagetes erecta TaxID=13708 RepID=A0AAD8NLQ8_TARER|nr:hypothetical protein QVD17_29880 [Tagetes erecta]